MRIVCEFSRPHSAIFAIAAGHSCLDKSGAIVSTWWSFHQEFVMSLRRFLAICALSTVLACSAWCAAEDQAENSASKGSAAPANKAWIARSNENAQLLLKLQAKYGPEFASRQGVPGLDEEVTQFPKDRRTQQEADQAAALAELNRRLAAEKDPLVAQDLQIMVKAAEQARRGIELGE